jgi:hypothetical protein
MYSRSELRGNDGGREWIAPISYPEKRLTAKPAKHTKKIWSRSLVRISLVDPSERFSGIFSGDLSKKFFVFFAVDCSGAD